MAGSQSGTAMLAPRPAPTVTRLSPFVNQTGTTARFSPNGDGVLDGARVDFTLKAAATAVRLDVLNAAGAVVQTVALGPRAAGANSATWNGRLTGGAWAPAGSYLLRVTATDSAGADHAGPTAELQPGRAEPLGRGGRPGGTHALPAHLGVAPRWFPPRAVPWSRSRSRSAACRRPRFSCR